MTVNCHFSGVTLVQIYFSVHNLNCQLLVSSTVRRVKCVTYCSVGESDWPGHRWERGNCFAVVCYHINVVGIYMFNFLIVIKNHEKKNLVHFTCAQMFSGTETYKPVNGTFICYEQKDSIGSDNISVFTAELYLLMIISQMM